MPVYESSCVKADCKIRGMAFERYYRSSEYIAPECPECGSAMERLVSRFNPTWCRSMDFYNNKKLEYAQDDGHWVTRVRSTKRADGKPEREYITSRSQQLKFIREENLVDPADIGEVQTTENGQVGSTRGLPGQWI